MMRRNKGKADVAGWEGRSFTLCKVNTAAYVSDEATMQTYRRKPN